MRRAAKFELNSAKIADGDKYVESYIDKYVKVEAKIKDSTPTEEDEYDDSFISVPELEIEDASYTCAAIPKLSVSVNIEAPVTIFEKKSASQG